MKILALFLCAVLAAGCSATTRVNVAAGTGGAMPAAGTRTTGGTFGLHVQGGSGAAALVAAGTVAALVASGDARGERYRVLPWDTAPPPEMLEGRAINLQDCTKPIRDYTANLRCR